MRYGASWGTSYSEQLTPLRSREMISAENASSRAARR
jgi:hypothetical protein